MAPLVVVDTDVMSFLFNQDPVRGPVYQRILVDRSPIIPFIVPAEMRFGAEKRGWGPVRRARLEAFLRGYDVVYPDDRTCRVWASVMSGVLQKGRVIERQDAWVAATALSLGLPLVTNNVSHFSSVPLLQVITE